jgi:hypothetical protein
MPTEDETEREKWTRAFDKGRRPLNGGPSESSGPDDPSKEAPRPLFRIIPESEPFPLDALGKRGAPAARDVQRATKAPAAICGQSTLATMNVSVMGHINIKLPHGEVKPTSEFLASIGETGIGKTTADNRATAGIIEHESEGYDAYHEKYFEYVNDLEAWKTARNQITAKKQSDAEASRTTWQEQLKKLGKEPEPPTSSQIMVGSDPTFEGLIRFYGEGGLIAAQFTSEGGAFIGGHSMNDDARLRTVTGLSHFWDGAPVPRTRAKEKHWVLRGRRLALHIQIQPRLGQGLFGDLDLVDQGVLTRILAVMPEPPPVSELLFTPTGDLPALDKFSNRVKELLARPFQYLEPKRPRTVSPRSS